MNTIELTSTASLSTTQFTQPNTDEIVGSSIEIQRLRTQVQRLGPHFRTVLLRGEVGTGKELVGRALHRLSSHAAGPFVVFNAAANSAAAPNSAATANVAPVGMDIPNLIKLAHRGTLYLNQIGELSATAQSDLLAELKSRDRVSGRIVVHGLEARIIASTTANLRVLAASGRFLEELYTRLSALEIELSPLRERLEDIPALANYFVAQQAQSCSQQVNEISDNAIHQMEAHRWPGNTGEMKQLLELATANCRNGRIEAEDLKFPDQTAAPATSPDSSMSARLQEVVERHVFHILKECAGNKVRAAEMLGISRSTLYRMLDAGLVGNSLVGLR